MNLHRYQNELPAVSLIFHFSYLQLSKETPLLPTKIQDIDSIGNYSLFKTKKIYICSLVRVVNRNDNQIILIPRFFPQWSLHY